MASVPGDEFVTIVPVGEGRPAAPAAPAAPAPPPARDPTYVTVLTLGAAAGAAEVVVRRPRGARLGLGLKFEGGSAAAEKVRRLLVQSCTEDSPAANAVAPWGKLIPGDEILAIDGVSVSELTRIDCVRRLKESDETLTLLVRHFEPGDDTEQKSTDTVDAAQNIKQQPKEMMSRPTTLPPPVPPRKLGKKNSFKDKSMLHTVGEQNGITNTELKDATMNGQIAFSGTLNNKLSRKSSFDSHLHRQSKETIASLKRGSPEEVRRLVRRLSDGKTMPPEAEVYIDLLSTEWERCLALADAESDDTGSSISTVVDRLGSIASSVENSIPSTPILQPKTIDIQKVLNCIENIDSDILKDITSTTIIDKQVEVKSEFRSVEKHIITNGINPNPAPVLTEDVSFIEEKPPNDKSNSTTGRNASVHTEANEGETSKKPESKEVTMEKPKPMPRNAKIERATTDKKPKQIPLPETPPPPLPEPLLTPTKKNCIETWLQRSEAEMNIKNPAKLEEEEVPEALPRLIDFVPKPQYKESEVPVPLARPTSAPPPPPLAEPREDGSGASLDTIGELDEPSDVIDHQKTQAAEKETKERKASYESGFWEDRANRSDAEDKSLSNDESLLPTCPRQPPDGVETPADAVEKSHDSLATRMPPRLPAGWPTRTRLSYTSRSQDARSEASVKDKIAMFSNEHSSSSELLDKCGTLPSRPPPSVKKTTTPYSIAYSDVSSLDRRLTKSQDNLDEVPSRSYKRHSERPEVLGALESTATKMSSVRSSRPLQGDNKPLFYGSVTALPSTTPEPSFPPPVFHSRSSSDDSGSSVHKSNLEYLIEQRKKSMSKLRGLVIPETHQAPITDLPAIKVQDSFTNSFNFNTNKSSHTTQKQQKQNTPKVMNLSEKKWKTELLPNNLPKYSPAFKRRPLQVYSPTSMSKESTPERRFSEKVDAMNKTNFPATVPTKPPRSSLDIKSMSELSTSTLPPKFSQRLSGKEYFNDLRNYNNLDIKICTATDIIDSDNDSAMSSTQSSYRSSASSPLHNLDSIESDSSRLSPRICHITSYSLIKTEIPSKTCTMEKSCEEYVKRPVCRSASSDTNVSLSSSAGSAATSGSQASCSSLESSVADSDKKKIGKGYNIDTINRRNILASAKCRSGRDAKMNSPVVESKFSHESSDRSPSPSPQPKPSERLSTLTSTVSAITNKGDNRRRNKIIAETDSDSDEEVNIRQRKNEFKNTRLKRNSSASNKNKQNETLTDSPKIEDAPKAISERIIQEIKKAGLENYNIIKAKSTIENNNVDVIRNDSVVVRQEDKVETISKSKSEKLNNSSSESLLLVAEKSKPVVNGNTATVTNGRVKLLVEDSKGPTRMIRLRRGAGTGVGLILAGGIDCEAKEVTVHRVLADSVADRAGLRRGARVRSINNCAMAGLTHAQSVAILKEQRSEVIIEIEDEIQENGRGVGCGSEKAESKVRSDVKSTPAKAPAASAIVTVVVEKAGGGAGLGFGLDGGRDSPHGDRPLTIKKLFAGGAAARSGRILVGAELLSAGGQSMEGFTRTQAWAALKSLPAGPVSLVLKNPIGSESES
ncbi:uncharacterized protein LOC105389187 [Plutella xylostella]|uniref:uncharacterized protein LOC105389187 n=1 Tax=Plutella xylostella TaxID=51655 RepID=UPI0020324AC2|nr:uncharacterized protein LOC105389187 [Plutella xylostella]